MTIMLNGSDLTVTQVIAVAQGCPGPDRPDSMAAWNPVPS
jgi:hypothetical protein